LRFTKQSLAVWLLSRSNRLPALRVVRLGTETARIGYYSEDAVTATVAAARVLASSHRFAGVKVFQLAGCGDRFHTLERLGEEFPGVRFHP
jgi:hypothetical protein